MSAAEKVHIYPDQVHPDVASVLQEYSVTPEEYHLLMDDVIFNTETAEDSFLSQPFLDPKDTFGSPKERQDAYNEIRQEFIDDEIGPISFAKQYAATGLASLDFSEYGLDSFESPEVLGDLQALGIDLESLSMWHVVTALKSGERIFENIESPEEIALSLASGAYSTDSEEQFTQWYSIALYATGASLYEHFDDEHNSHYHAYGVPTVNMQMNDLVSSVLARNPVVQQLVGAMWDRQITAKKAVDQLIDKQNAQDQPVFQPYPEYVHPDLTAKLQSSQVTWEELMYIYGGVVIPYLTPEYFKFQWFAQLLSENIDDVAQAKNLPAHEDLTPVVEALGYTPQDGIVFSRWEEGLLQEVFNPKKYSLDKDKEPAKYWRTIGKLSNIPYLIRDNAQVKTYVYYAYILAELHVLERIGHEESIRRLERGDESFLNPSQILNDVQEVAQKANQELFIPDVSAIFSEMDTGLSLEVTRERIEFATEQIHTITLAQLKEASRQLTESLKNLHSA